MRYPEPIPDILIYFSPRRYRFKHGLQTIQSFFEAKRIEDIDYPGSYDTWLKHVFWNVRDACAFLNQHVSDGERFDTRDTKFFQVLKENCTHCACCWERGDGIYVVANFDIPHLKLYLPISSSPPIDTFTNVIPFNLEQRS